MKKVFSFSFFKTMFLLLIVYIINVACFSNSNPFPTPNPSTTKTIYAACNGIIASVVFSTNAASIIQAESHAQTHQNDLEKLVTTPYAPVSNHHMWIEGGVSTFNCSDHDHISNISIGNGISAISFSHDVQYGGTVWLQFISQCEEERLSNGAVNLLGVYFKGEMWYGPNDYPVVHRADIVIDQAIITDCNDPWPAEEYGCGEDDVQ